MTAKLLRSFLSTTSGATAIEYGLIAVLIAVGMLAGVTAFSDKLNNTFTTVNTSMEPAAKKP